MKIATWNVNGIRARDAQLHEFIEREQPSSIATWISDDVYRKVEQAVAEVGPERLKPIWLKLDEKVTYEDIRIVMAHLRMRDVK